MLLNNAALIFFFVNTVSVPPLYNFYEYNFQFQEQEHFEVFLASITNCFPEVCTKLYRTIWGCLLPFDWANSDYDFHFLKFVLFFKKSLFIKFLFILDYINIDNSICIKCFLILLTIFFWYFTLFIIYCAFYVGRLKSFVTHVFIFYSLLLVFSLVGNYIIWIMQMLIIYLSFRSFFNCICRCCAIFLNINNNAAADGQLICVFGTVCCACYVI